MYLIRTTLGNSKLFQICGGNWLHSLPVGAVASLVENWLEFLLKIFSLDSHEPSTPPQLGKNYLCPIPVEWRILYPNNITGMTEASSQQVAQAPFLPMWEHPLYKIEDHVSHHSSSYLSNSPILNFSAPGVDLSLQERLDNLFPSDGPKVDIGFMREKGSRNEKEGRVRVAEWRRRVRADKELEKKARDGTLQVPLILNFVLLAGNNSLSFLGWPWCSAQPVGWVRWGVWPDLRCCRALWHLWRSLPARPLLALSYAPGSFWVWSFLYFFIPRLSGYKRMGRL